MSCIKHQQGINKEFYTKPYCFRIFSYQLLIFAFKPETYLPPSPLLLSTTYTNFILLNSSPYGLNVFLLLRHYRYTCREFIIPQNSNLYPNIILVSCLNHHRRWRIKTQTRPKRIQIGFGYPRSDTIYLVKSISLIKIFIFPKSNYIINNKISILIF